MRLWIKLVLKPLWKPSILPLSSNPRRPRWREVPPNCLHSLFYPNYYLFAKWRYKDHKNESYCLLARINPVLVQNGVSGLLRWIFLREEVSVAFGDITNSREGGLSDVITLAWIGASITIDTIITFLSGIPYLYKNQKGAKKTSVPLSHLQFPWLLLSAASSYHHLPSFSQSTILAGHNCIKWSLIGIFFRFFSSWGI